MTDREGALRQVTEPLTTPQIIALARLSRNAAYRHLTDLEREGLVKRLGEGRGGGGAHRWYWRTDLDGAVAS